MPLNRLTRLMNSAFNTANRTTARQRLSRRLRCENLESRQLMTADGWSIAFGDVGSDGVDGSTVDDVGNVYVATRYQGTVDLAPNESFSDNRDILSALPGERGMALVKYDPAGSLLWVQTIDTGGTVAGMGSGVIRNVYVENGGLYFDGYHKGILDFDGSGSDPTAVINQTSATEFGGFVGRFDGETGAFDWVREAGQGSRGTSFSLAVDQLGNSHFAFEHGIGQPSSFDGVVIPNSSGYQATIVSLDADGQLQNIETIKSSSYLYQITLGVDDSAANPSDWNVVVAGLYSGDTQFSDGTWMRKTNSDYDVFVASIDSSGAVDWANQYFAAGRQYVHRLAVDDQGDIFVLGPVDASTSTLVFDGNSASGTLTNMASREYLLQLRPDGSFERAAAIGTPRQSNGAIGAFVRAIEPTESGILIAGEFRETTTIADVTLTAAGSSDGFVMLLSNDMQSVHWHKQFGGTDLDRIWDAKYTQDGKVVVSGDFRGTAQLLTGEVVTSNGGSDGFVSYVEVPEVLPPVDPPNTGPVTLFADSFEIGSNSKDWNGKWWQDSQNDFFRSTQRSTEGSRSAEVDGFANNARLTLSSPVNLSGYDTAILTFDWLIESGFNYGEYLSLDVSTNGGSSWIQDVRRLNGNQDAENVWHSETVNLSDHTSGDILIRFRSKVRHSRSDANIDNVLIIGSNQASGQLAGSQAVPEVEGFASPVVASPVVASPVVAEQSSRANRTERIELLSVDTDLNSSSRGVAGNKKIFPQTDLTRPLPVDPHLAVDAVFAAENLSRSELAINLLTEFN